MDILKSLLGIPGTKVKVSKDGSKAKITLPLLHEEPVRSDENDQSTAAVFGQPGFPQFPGGRMPFPQGGGRRPFPQGAGMPFPQIPSGRFPFPQGGGRPAPFPQGGGIPFPQIPSGRFPFPQGGGRPAPFPQGGGMPFPQIPSGRFPFPQGGGQPIPNPFPYPQGGGQPFPQPLPIPQGGGQPFPQPFPQPIPVPQGGGLPIPQPMPAPSPESDKSSSVNIWAQDPTNPMPVATMQIALKKGFPANLQGSRIRIQRISDAKFTPDENGNVLLQPGAPGFDEVSVYGTVDMVWAMYERALGKEIVTPWKGPLKVIINDQEEANAFFGPAKQALILRYFRDFMTQQVVYTCQMFDVITHEIGHGILYFLQPNSMNVNASFETNAFHEAFGDVTTLLTMLNNKDYCKYIAEAAKSATGTDLHIPTFFSDFSEQFGEALLRKNNGLRNADDDATISNTQQESHDRSRAFVGVFYDVLAEMNKKYQKINPAKDKGEILYDVGTHALDLFVKAVVSQPDGANLTFGAILGAMYNAETDDDIKQAFATISAQRGIVLHSKEQMPWPAQAQAVYQPALEAAARPVVMRSMGAGQRSRVSERVLPLTECDEAEVKTAAAARIGA
jgi:hypothetical protein